jgi:hypothetical protein
VIWLVAPDGRLAVIGVEDLADPKVAELASGCTWVFSVAHAFALSRERGRR